MDNLIDFLILIISYDRWFAFIFVFGLWAMFLFECTAWVAKNYHRDAISLENYIFIKQLKKYYFPIMALPFLMKLMITGF